MEELSPKRTRSDEPQQTVISESTQRAWDNGRDLKAKLATLVQTGSAVVREIDAKQGGLLCMGLDDASSDGNFMSIIKVWSWPVLKDIRKHAGGLVTFIEPETAFEKMRSLRLIPPQVILGVVDWENCGSIFDTGFVTALVSRLNVGHGALLLLNEHNILLFRGPRGYYLCDSRYVDGISKPLGGAFSIEVSTSADAVTAVMAYGAHRLFLQSDDQGNTFDKMDVWVRSCDPRVERRVALTVQFLTPIGLVDASAGLERWTEFASGFSAPGLHPSGSLVLNVGVPRHVVEEAAGLGTTPTASAGIATSTTATSGPADSSTATSGSAPFGEAPLPPPSPPTAKAAALEFDITGSPEISAAVLCTPEEIRAAVLDLQNVLAIMERRNHPGEKGRWNRFDTARRKVINHRALPRYQSGNLKYPGHAVDSTMIHGTAVPIGVELAAFEKWSRGIYVDPRVKDVEDPAELRRLLECAASHASIHSELRVPAHRPPAGPLEYKLNWGRARYEAFQGKTLREIGEIGPSGVTFLQWIVSPEFTWNQSTNHLVMLASLNRLIEQAVVFSTVSPPWKITWEHGACPFAMLEALNLPKRGRGRPSGGGSNSTHHIDGDSSDDDIEDADRRELERCADSSDDECDESDCGAGYYKITATQRAAWDDLRLGRSNTYGVNLTEFRSWPNEFADPPDPASCLIDATKPSANFGKVLSLFSLRRIHFFDPHKRYGVPMPCAQHGFGCRTRRRGWNVKLRRISGISDDELLGSGTYECTSNVRLKRDALKNLRRLQPSKESSPDAYAAALSVYKSIHYQFKTTDPRVTKLYASSTTYSWVALKIPASVYRRTAVSTELAMFMHRQASYQSANDLTLLLRELKCQKHAMRKNCFYSLQLLWRRTRSASVAVVLDEPIILFPENYQDNGGSFVSTNFILDHTKLFFDKLAPWIADFHASNFLNGETLALDHHLKVGKGTTAAGIGYGQYKLSVFNNHGIVEASNYTSSASFEDPTTQAVIRDHLKARDLVGAPEIQVVTIDNVYRDGQGVRSLYRAPSIHPEQKFAFPGRVLVVTSASEENEAETLLSKFSVLGLDTERVAYIPPVKQGPRGKPVAQVQLAGGSGASSVCCIYPVHKTGFGPGLLRILANAAIEKVVLNAHSDVSHLRDAGVSAILNVTELKTVVQNANPLPPLHGFSLKLLVAHPQLCGSSIDKSIPHEMWEAPVLSQRQIEYMANDAYAHLAVYEAAKALRERADRGTPQPRHAASDAVGPPAMSARTQPTHPTARVQASESAEATTEAQTQPLLPTPPRLTGLSYQLSGSDLSAVELALDSTLPDQEPDIIDAENSSIRHQPVFDELGGEAALFVEASRSIKDYAAGSESRPLHLNAALKEYYRGRLHVLAGNLGLCHQSEDHGSGRHLVISRWRPLAVVTLKECEEAIGALVLRASDSSRGVVRSFDVSTSKWQCCFQDSTIEYFDVAELNASMRRRFDAEMSGIPVTAARGSVMRPLGGISDDEAKKLIAGVRKDWKKDILKYDIRHWMGNLFLIVANKHSALFPFFANAVSDAVFKIMDGERQRLIGHLCTFMSPEAIAALSRKYFRRRCRCIVPEPETIIRDLTDVFNLFVDMDDPSRPDTKFLVASARATFLKEVAYVQEGLLSDRPGFNMYVEMRTLASGFVIYRCYRSSSQLEGYHLHLREILCAGQIACSPRLLHALSTLFDYRWNVKSAVKAKLLQDSGHYALYLVDELYDVTKRLAETVRPNDSVFTLTELLTWRRTRADIPRIRGGITGSLALTDTQSVPLHPRSSASSWVAQTTGLNPPSALRSTREVATVLQNPSSAIAGDAETLRKSSGIVTTPTILSEMARSVAAREEAKQSLDARGYGAAMERVRETIPEQLNYQPRIAPYSQLAPHDGNASVLPTPPFLGGGFSALDSAPGPADEFDSPDLDLDAAFSASGKSNTQRSRKHRDQLAAADAGVTEVHGNGARKKKRAAEVSELGRKPWSCPSASCSKRYSKQRLCSEHPALMCVFR